MASPGAVASLRGARFTIRDSRSIPIPRSVAHCLTALDSLVKMIYAMVGFHLFFNEDSGRHSCKKSRTDTVSSRV